MEELQIVSHLLEANKNMELNRESNGSMEKFIKEQDDLKKSIQVEAKLDLEKQGGKGIYTVSIIMILVFVCGFGISMSRSGGMAIVVKSEESSAGGAAPSMKCLDGDNGRCVAEMKKTSEEEVALSDTGKGEEFLECQVITISRGCNFTLCPDRVEIDYFGLKLTTTNEAIVNFAPIACFSKEEKIICSLKSENTMLYFTVDECGTICNLFA